ncbi:MAG: LptA/OstA family protein [Terriglobia bacterium]
MNGFDLQTEGKHSRSRKRRLAVLIGIAAVVVFVTIATSYWKSLKKAAHATTVVAPLPKDVDRALSGYTFTRSEGGRQIFTVRAARTLAFKDGSKTVLQDVRVEIFGRGGNRHDSLTAGQCVKDADGALSCAGKAEIELRSRAGLKPTQDLNHHQPLLLDTSDVSYVPKEDVVRTDAPVSFRFGPASGSATGLAYATKDDWVKLNRNVAIHLPARRSSGEPKSSLANATGHDQPSGPPLNLSARSLFYRKDTGEITLQGPVKVTQGNRSLTAPEGAIDLDSENRVRLVLLQGGIQAVELNPDSTLRGSAQLLQGDFDPSSGELRNLIASGNVQMNGLKGAAGDSRSLMADRVQINFTGPKNVAANGTATGHVQLSLVTPGVAPDSKHKRATETQLSGGKNVLTASELDFMFRDGKALQSAKTPGPGKLVLLPGTPGVGRREITAGRFAMSFDPLGRLSTLRGLDSSHITFFPAPGSKPPASIQESFADQLQANLNPATEEVENLRQWGRFRYLNGDRHASAKQAEYEASSQTLTLTGDPLLVDPDTRIRAVRFLIHMDTDTAMAQGKVQSTHFDSAKAGAKDQSPGQIEADTINVIADQAMAERESQFVHYEGHVRAWSRSDVVESPALDVRKQQRRITSGAGVVTSLLQPGTITPANDRSKHRTTDTQPVIIRADRLLYFDERREARYLGDVEMATGGAVLHAAQMNVYFSQPSASGGSEVERAVATGHVVVTEPGRRATGNQAEYFAPDGKVVMTGGPPTLDDEAQGFTTGRRLTFFIDGASLVVDGGKEAQTLSKRLMVHE